MRKLQTMIVGFGIAIAASSAPPGAASILVDFEDLGGSGVLGDGYGGIR